MEKNTQIAQSGQTSVTDLTGDLLRRLFSESTVPLSTMQTEAEVASWWKHYAGRVRNAMSDGITMTAPSDAKPKTARDLADRYGHTYADSNTTLMTEVNPSDTAEMMDLTVYGAGDAAYFEWTSASGDPLGDVFYTLDIAEKNLPAVEAGGCFVIYSDSESATSGDGFWNNDVGWTTFDRATKFSATELRTLIPSVLVLTGQDARWVADFIAQASYARPEPGRNGTDVKPVAERG